MFVYLDDCRTPPEGWTLVKTVQDAIDLLKTNKVQIISLDHDLATFDENGKESKGIEVLDWIQEQVFINDFVPPEMLVHSSNASAVQLMTIMIKNINQINDFR